MYSPKTHFGFNESTISNIFQIASVVAFFFVFNVEKCVLLGEGHTKFYSSLGNMNHFPFAAPLQHFIFPDTESTAEKSCLINLYSQSDSWI